MTALDNAPAHWTRTTIGEIAEVSGGIQKQPSRKARQNTAPFLRVANVREGWLDLDNVHRIEVFEGELERYRLAAGDLLVVEGNGSLSHIGRSAEWRGEIDDCVHQNHLIRVRPGADVLPRYLNWYWNSPLARPSIEARARTTSGLYTLSTAKVREVPVLLPPTRDEQQRIVDALERMWSHLMSGQASLESARERAASLHVVEHHMVAETPGPRVPLSELADVIAGPAFKSAQFVEEGVRLLRGSNVAPGRLEWAPDVTRHWSVEDVAPYERYLLEQGDIIVAMDRPVISTGLKMAAVTERDLPALLVQRVARIRVRESGLRSWVLACLGAPGFVSHLAGDTTGTQLPHITLAGIRSHTIPLPNASDRRAALDRLSLARSHVQRTAAAAERTSERGESLGRALVVAALTGRLVDADDRLAPAPSGQEFVA